MGDGRGKRGIFYFKDCGVGGRIDAVRVKFYGKNGRRVELLIKLH